MASAKPSRSPEDTYGAVSAAEILVSSRSKATEGMKYAMYSIVLFMVETPFSKVLGSGHSPMSAELR